MNGYRISVRYNFVRSRQLEGTFPGDRATGYWPITAHRISYGWGDPPEESWPYVTDWPPEEPPGIDLIAKKHRLSLPYKRVRSIAECKEELLVVRKPVTVSLDITDKWANPWHGQIPALSANDIVLPTMHNVLLVGFHRDRDEFIFRNSWGPAWGDEGDGYIRAERLAAVWWEAWTISPTRIEKSALAGTAPHLRSVAVKQHDGSTFHWLDLVDEEYEPLGWASAVQSSEAFEIEELFVRPSYRVAGHGKKLFQSMEKTAKELGLPVRMWISFANTAPQNLNLIEKIVRPSGLAVLASGVRWAPLVAAPAAEYTQVPVPSFSYPTKPPSAPSQLVPLARDIAVGLGTGIASTFLADAFKSWMNPDNGKRINAKLGDMELSTSEVSTDDFIKIVKALQNVKEEADIGRKLLEAGITITVVEASRNTTDDQS